jgi:hypothetical protein
MHTCTHIYVYKHIRLCFFYHSLLHACACYLSCYVMYAKTTILKYGISVDHKQIARVHVRVVSWNRQQIAENHPLLLLHATVIDTCTLTRATVIDTCTLTRATVIDTCTWFLTSLVTANRALRIAVLSAGSSLPYASSAPALALSARSPWLLPCFTAYTIHDIWAI